MRRRANPFDAGARTLPLARNPLREGTWRCSPLPLLLPLLLLLFFPFTLASPQDTPTITVNDDCTALAYAPDGRLAYAVRHILKTKRLEMQRDDIWVIAPDGKRRRIVNGEKLVQGPAAFSYTVRSFRWAPDGTRLTVELLTSEMIDVRGNTREGEMTLLLDENGKEIKIAGADSVIPDGTDGAWLADGVTVVYLREAVQPRLLYSIHSVRPVAGRGGPMFPDSVFAAVAWNQKQNTAVAVERDRSLKGAFRLVALDLVKETRRELTTLDGFAGRLSLSPSGSKVAYFRDPEVLEIRDLTAPERVGSVRIGIGDFQWAPDERRVLFKRGPERRSGDLVWVSLPPLAPHSRSPEGIPAPVSEATPQIVLHGLAFRDFDLSPDGRFLAVLQPGERHLLIFPIQ